jgi:hypothetical protein
MDDREIYIDDGNGYQWGMERWARSAWFRLYERRVEQRAERRRRVSRRFRPRQTELGYLQNHAGRRSGISWAPRSIAEHRLQAWDYTVPPF